MKISFRVEIADIADDGADPIDIVWDIAGFHFGAEKIAKDAAEVFVAWVAQERAAIGKHTDEAA